MDEFKFKIGDLVTTRAAIAECEDGARVGQCRTPMRFVIVERRTQECPGGMQLHYMLARDGKSGLFNEIEVASIDDWKPIASLKQIIEYHLAMCAWKRPE